MEKKYIILDGNSLKPEELVSLSSGKLFLKLSEISIFRVNRARALLDDIVLQNKKVYGITTGFGNFANVVIPHDKLDELQENLIRSHCAGVGDPLSPERTRMLLALRINVLAKGFSGISLENLQKLIDAFNSSCLSVVPCQGTVGASGDLAPLAHLALGVMGEGRMWSPKTGYDKASKVLSAYALEPMKLTQKEGLALINGTQLITALSVEGLVRADACCRQADVIVALTFEVLKGTTRAFDSDIHSNRPHCGQMKVAHRLRSLLHSDVHPSEIAESHRFCMKVQDAYTLRCAPQVHGVVNDTVDFVRSILSVEMNSATDNPMVLSKRNEIISAGNFHGEYPAKAADYLAIAVHELANMSERRIERLVNPGYSGLPAFLVEEGGLNSGFMMTHCTAAALVSENKVLCHPASVDSLSTSAGQEDHVSMGGFAARKLLNVIENVERVLAIELLTACQGIEFLRPLRSTAPLEAVYDVVRMVAPPLGTDRVMSDDVEAVTQLLREEKVWEAVRPHLEAYKAGQTTESRHWSPTTSYADTAEAEMLWQTRMGAAAADILEDEASCCESCGGVINKKRKRTNDEDF